MPSPLKPLADDTSLVVETMLFDHYRGLDVPEKLAIAWSLNRLGTRLALQSIRERHPEADEHEQRVRLAAIKYGRELVLAAYGWDPSIEGW